MADASLISKRSREILLNAGWSHLKTTVRCNDGAALYPGMIVTKSGHTDGTTNIPDVGRLDGIGEIPFAVLGLPGDHDMETNFADNDEVVAYRIRSGAVIMTKMTGAAAVTEGEIMIASTGDNGWVTPAHVFAHVIGTGSLVWRAAKSYVGIAMETIASNASVTPLKVALI